MDFLCVIVNVKDVYLNNIIVRRERHRERQRRDMHSHSESSDEESRPNKLVFYSRTFFIIHCHLYPEKLIPNI